MAHVQGLGYFGNKSTTLSEGQDPRHLETLYMNEKHTDIDKAIESFGLNYEAQEQELVTQGGIVLPDHKAIVHSETSNVLGVTGMGYSSVQPYQACYSMHEAIKDMNPTYVSGGYVKNGQRMFLIADVHGEKEVREGDTISNYVMLTTNFAGKGSFEIFSVPFRPICSNQARAVAEGMTFHHRIRHTTRINEYVKDAIMMISQSGDAYDNYIKRCRTMAETRVNQRMVEDTLTQLFGDTTGKEEAKGAKLSTISRREDIKASVRDRFESGMGNSGETAWDLYNGITEYYTHEWTENKQGSQESLLFGTGAKALDKAFALTSAL